MPARLRLVLSAVVAPALVASSVASEAGWLIVRGADGIYCYDLRKN